MYYIIEYEITALIFLMVVGAHFFEKRQFPHVLNHLFGWIVICGIIDIALDIIGSVLIENAAVVPSAILYIVNASFYSLQLCLPALMLVYVLILCNAFNRRRCVVALLPAAVFELLLLSNGWTHWMFYFTDTGVLTHGSIFILLYSDIAFYLLTCGILVVLRKNQLQYKQFTTILGFIFIIAAATAIQLFHPRLLLTGVAIALAITLMYFTMQTPEDMLDPVSEIFNYRALQQFLRNRLKEKKPFHLIAVDIHGLRRVNNMFGMENGNELLRQMGFFFQTASLEKKSWAFRMFGARFVLICSSREHQLALAQQINDRFSDVWRVEQMDVLLQATVRYFSQADWQEHTREEDIFNMIEATFDDAERHHEQGTCNEVARDALARLERRLRLETALRRDVIAGRGFELYFQPLYDINSCCFTSAEVLLRYTHPKLGMIPPVEFIPLAERMGLISQIDEMVIRRSCEFINRISPLEQYGLKHIEINLSAAEFLDRTLPQRLRTLVDEYKVNPALLRFEITETAATASYEVVSKYIAALHEDNFCFVLDDFGSGYANLTQVAQLPFAMVKLDRSLLLADSAVGGTSTLFEDMLKMFRRLGVTTVVEGVETEEQARRIHELKADYIQGFYYAKPMPEQHFIDFLIKNIAARAIS